MAQELITIARPYAQAVYDRARDTDKLDSWSDMLALLSAVTGSPEVSGLVSNPRVQRAGLRDLILGVCQGRLSAEGENLLRLLIENDRLLLLPHIAQFFEQLKNERQGLVKVEVRSAYVLNQAQHDELARALKARLGRDIEISSEQDPELIGGVVIHAGDLVIDGSVRGQLHKLANELSL